MKKTQSFSGVMYLKGVVEIIAGWDTSLPNNYATYTCLTPPYDGFKINKISNGIYELEVNHATIHTDDIKEPLIDE